MIDFAKETLAKNFLVAPVVGSIPNRLIVTTRNSDKSSILNALYARWLLGSLRY